MLTRLVAPLRLRWLTRRRAFSIHSWTGVVTGVFMLLIAWSGSIAVFKHEVDWLLTPALRATPTDAPATLDTIVSGLQTRYPGADVTLQLQRGPRSAHTAIASTDAGQRHVWINPASGEVVREVPVEGYTWSTGNFIRQLHLRLLMGRWGAVFVPLFGVTLVLSIVTSLWIYREWIRSLFRLRRGSGRRLFYSDMHKVIGFWSLAFNLLIAVTGAVLGLPVLYARMIGDWYEPASATANVEAIQSMRVLEASRRLPISELVMLARDAAPEFEPHGIDVPADTEASITIWGDHPGALIEKNTSFVSLDPYSGRVIASHDARRATWGSRLFNAFTPLHFGYFGEQWHPIADYSIKTLWFVLGLTPGFLALTGGVMWIIRRRRVRAAAAQAAPHDTRAGQAPVVAGEAWPEAHARRRLAWRLFAVGLTPFVVAGYVLQAIVWRDGWALTELLWQHWIVKPVCLLVVLFPVTVPLVLVGWRAIDGTARGRLALWAPVLAALPLGVCYLVATSMLN